MGRSVTPWLTAPRTRTLGSKKAKGVRRAPRSRTRDLLLPCSTAPRHGIALMFAAQESMASSSKPNASDEMDQLVKLQRAGLLAMSEFVRMSREIAKTDAELGPDVYFFGKFFGKSDPFEIV